jgi:hypothetical protein
MSRQLTDKASRTVRLLFGMRNPVIAKALERYGFTEDVIHEGWRVLREASPNGPTPMGRPANVNDATITMLEDWQSEWFPVINLALERHHPAVADQLFAGLQRGAGPMAALSVSTLITRLDQMSAGQGGYEAAGVAARRTLEARGVTTGVIDEAKALLAEVEHIAEHPTVATKPGAEAEAAEEALFAWYREWSGIARVAIRSRGILRQLGLVGSRRLHDDESNDGVAAGGTADDATGDNSTTPPSGAGAPPAPLGAHVDP